MKVELFWVIQRTFSHIWNHLRTFYLWYLHQLHSLPLQLLPTPAVVLAVQVTLPQLTDPWAIRGITLSLMSGTGEGGKQVYQKATESSLKFCSTSAADKLSRKQQQSRLRTGMKPSSNWTPLTSETVSRWTVSKSSTHVARRGLPSAFRVCYSSLPGSLAAYFHAQSSK